MSNIEILSGEFMTIIPKSIHYPLFDNMTILHTEFRIQSIHLCVYRVSTSQKSRKRNLTRFVLNGSNIDCIQ
jgi:hypothetical protein